MVNQNHFNQSWFTANFDLYLLSPLNLLMDSSCLKLNMLWWKISENSTNICYRYRCREEFFWLENISHEIWKFSSSSPSRWVIAGKLQNYCKNGQHLHIRSWQLLRSQHLRWPGQRKRSSFSSSFPQSRNSGFNSKTFSLWLFKV